MIVLPPRIVGDMAHNYGAEAICHDSELLAMAHIMVAPTLGTNCFDPKNRYKWYRSLNVKIKKSRSSCPHDLVR
jgi:hypothetical protein